MGKEFEETLHQRRSADGKGARGGMLGMTGHWKCKFKPLFICLMVITTKTDPTKSCPARGGSRLLCAAGENEKWSKKREMGS